MVRQFRSLWYLLLLSGVLHLSVFYFVRIPVTKSSAIEYFQASVSLRLQEVRESRNLPVTEVHKEVQKEVQKEESKVPTPQIRPPAKKHPPAASLKASAVQLAPSLSVPVITATPEKSVGKTATPEELVLSPEQLTAQKLDKALAAEDILSNAKRSVGKIDKDLRADVVAPARAAMMGREGPSKFAQAIAKAGIPRTMQGEVIYGPGGQQFTKYSGPNGTFCVSVPRAERMFGQGRIDEPGIRVTNCPS